MACDCTSKKDIDAFVLKYKEALGGCYLHHAAGILDDGLIISQSEERGGYEGRNASRNKATGVYPLFFDYQPVQKSWTGIIRLSQRAAGCSCQTAATVWSPGNCGSVGSLSWVRHGFGSITVTATRYLVASFQPLFK